MCLDSSIVVNTYISNNGFFKENSFVHHICDHNQLIQYCGINAHNQNDVA